MNDKESKLKKAAPKLAPRGHRLNDRELEKVSGGAKRRFEDRTKDLESQDKMDNFQIQDLMSR